MTTRRFYAPPENIADEIVLGEEETRHLRDVLRLKPGAEVNVFDGEGNEYAARVAAVEKRSSILVSPQKVEPASPESPLDLGIASVSLKGDKLDLVVQKAVELGVNRFIPMASIRCDVKVGDAKKRADRWRRIALEATKQCGRAKLMKVDDVVDFRELIDLSESWDATRVHFSEREGASFDKLTGAQRILAFIGPEGGWDDAELEKAKASEIISITFGGRIMKADTAAIAISSILQHRFGDIN